jgi:hypothetical protein
VDAKKLHRGLPGAGGAHCGSGLSRDCEFMPKIAAEAVPTEAC